MPLDTNLDQDITGRTLTDTELNDPPEINIGNVGVLDSADVRVDPSTSTNQASIITLIDQVEPLLTSIDSKITGASGGTPEHHNGTAGAAASTITFSSTTRTIVVENTSTSNDLEISFDSGANWKTVSKRGIIGDFWQANSMQIRRAGAVNATYEIVATT